MKQVNFLLFQSLGLQNFSKTLSVRQMPHIMKQVNFLLFQSLALQNFSKTLSVCQTLHIMKQVNFLLFQSLGLENKALSICHFTARLTSQCLLENTQCHIRLSSSYFNLQVYRTSVSVFQTLHIMKQVNFLLFQSLGLQNFSKALSICQMLHIMKQVNFLLFQSVGLPSAKSLVFTRHFTL